MARKKISDLLKNMVTGKVENTSLVIVSLGKATPVGEFMADLKLLSGGGASMRFYDDPEYRRAMKTQWNDGYSAAISNSRDLLGMSQEQVDDLLGELANVEQ